MTNHVVLATSDIFLVQWICQLTKLIGDSVWYLVAWFSFSFLFFSASVSPLPYFSASAMPRGKLGKSHSFLSVSLHLKNCSSSQKCSRIFCNSISLSIPRQFSVKRTCSSCIFLFKMFRIRLTFFHLFHEVWKCRERQSKPSTIGGATTRPLPLSVEFVTIGTLPSYWKSVSNLSSSTTGRC